MSPFDKHKPTDNDMFKAIFDHSPSALIVTDHNFLIVRANSKAINILGRSIKPSDCFLSLFSPSSKEEIEQHFNATNQGELPALDVKLSSYDIDKWLELSASNHQHKTKFIIWSLSDITAQKTRERELEHLAYFDSLTGVYSRQYFFQLAEMQLKQHHSENETLSILMLDIDDFKLVNDSHGHSTGDLVLQTFSTLISQTLRKSDLFGRIGGEEFAILLPHTKQQEAVLTATRICHAVEESFLEHNVTVSIGLVTLRNSDATIKDLLTYADQALYQVKQTGKNSVQVAELNAYECKSYKTLK
ncbi:diguanylate cyclase (plasmid) [Vibrio sp. B1REV9]|uniref:sensor domain-containing diguanylate cyclase n=1 Tax=Vibrio sp. B1REV9 TaxID=2751179 RepID=UPI001AECE6B6|nr:sensor domain-containing diguanylate cyclase [Vibrio sp. B1REV9]CAE6958857.1 diguanylate cyclase [Vibrio sp. B1REV9]